MKNSKKKHHKNKQDNLKNSLFRNLDLQPIHKDVLLCKLCSIKMHKLNIQEYIPISQLIIYKKLKKKFKMKKYTVKLNRIKLIWNKKIIFINTTIKI